MRSPAVVVTNQFCRRHLSRLIVAGLECFLDDLCASTIRKADAKQSISEGAAVMNAHAGDVSRENAHDGARAFHGGAGACAAPSQARRHVHVYDGHHECADDRALLSFREYVRARAAQSDAAKVQRPSGCPQ